MDRSVRSQFPSIKLDQLVYVELDSGNGGMMLTVSEEGFSFRAVSPVRTISRTPFSFVINGAEKLEGFGKIEWTKDDGKVAGLLFTDVTSGFLNSLKVWLAALCTPPTSPGPALSNSPTGISYRPSSQTSTKRNGEHLPGAGEFAPHRDSLEHLERPFEEQRPFETPVETVVQPRTALGLNFGQPLLGETRHGNEVAQTSVRPDPVTAVPGLSEWSYPETPPRRRVNGLMITAAAVCMLGLAILLFSYREVLGQTLISLGQKMSAPSETSQSQPSKTVETPKPAIEAQQTATSAVTGPPLQAGTQPQSGTVNNSSYIVRENAAAVKPDSTFQDARRDSAAAASAGSNLSAADSQDQIRSLWSAVSQGNTSAEVTLAKLYLIGGGVPKSCDQAKVLLGAAAKKGNGEAIDKLTQISQRGCP